jgi:Mg2+ and Co2+ transporter CorA
MCAKRLTNNEKSEKDVTEKNAKPEKKTILTKKKLVVSYKNLPPDVIELIKEQYPKGYSDYLIKVDRGNGDFFYAITLNTETIDYLIKVDVKIDSEIEEVEKALFEQSDMDDNYPDEEESFDQEEDREEDE